MPKSGDPLVYTHPPNYHNPPSTAWMATVADSVGLALAIIVVAARCHTKFRITKAPGWEDHFSVMALITFIVYWALNLLQRFEYGGGRHLYDIPPSMYTVIFGSVSAASSCIVPPTIVRSFLTHIQTGVVRGYLYILGLTLAKLSLLLFLYRIFKIDLTFRVLSWILGAVLVVWTTVSLLLCIFACKPIKASWVLSVQLDPATKCPIKAYDVNNIHGYCNIITDFALLLMPAPLVWKLHVDSKKKLGLAVVFGTGIFICTVSIVRQYINYHANKNGDDYYLGKLRVWFSLEFSFSIIVACLPIITPLLKKASVLAAWLPGLSSRLGASSGRQKESRPVLNQDIEHGAVRHDQDPPATWKVPAAWHEPGQQRFTGYDDASHGSDLTLQDLRTFGDHRESPTTKAYIIGLLTFCLMVHQWPKSFAAAAAPRLRTSRPTCWDDPDLFAPVVFKDCIDVVNNEITKGRDPTVPLKFSKDPTLHPDITLPKYWTRGDANCGVGVDFVPQMQGYDRTTLDDVQRAARAVAVECVIKEPHLGGFVQLGWNDRLGVLIAGAKVGPNSSNGTVE